MTNEFERNGLPAVFISNLKSVAQYMRVNRYLPGVAIPHVFGNPNLPLDEERELRLGMVRRALELLQTPGDALAGAPSQAREPELVA